MSVSVVCPKCGSSVQVPPMDTGLVQAFALCPKCGNTWRLK